MPAAQVAPSYELPRGKVVYLTLVPTRETKEAGLQLLENQYGDKVEFIRLNWSSTDGRKAADAFGIDKAPAAVLVDRNGDVVAKTQGALTTLEMERALKDLMK